MSELQIRSGDSGYHVPRRVEACSPQREPVADGQQCRIWLNEARREIDRLRSGLASRGTDVVRIGGNLGGNPAENGRCDEPKRVEGGPSVRRVYAPPALGDVSHVKPREMPPPVPAMQALHQYHITNVGSLLDVLA